MERLVVQQARHRTEDPTADRRSGPGPREVVDIHDPATGRAVGQVAVASPGDVANAVQAAREAGSGWARRAPGDRAELVGAVAARILEHGDALTRSTTAEMGRPAELARGGVQAAAAAVRQYAELAPLHRGRSLQGAWDAVDLMLPQPRGVVAVITPWNDPVAVPAALLAAALLTGNTVVFKPSERSPLTGEKLARLFAEDLPDGVLTVVQGDGQVGAAVVDAGVDVVVHVGSTAAGRAIAAAAAATGAKVVLENGGNDPLLVDEDVDPVWAAGQAALGGFINSGQLCTAVERVYVHESVIDEFVAALVKEAESLVMGPGEDPATTLGPLVDERARRAVHAQVREAQEAGASTWTGGFVPEGAGSFYPATVLTDVPPGVSVLADETFGPVLPVVAVPSFEAGLSAAASSPYGLAATVLTADMDHAQEAWRKLPVGTVKVNAVFGGAPGGAAQPRGWSGEGFGYGPELLDELTATKVVHLGRATRRGER